MKTGWGHEKFWRPHRGTPGSGETTLMHTTFAVNLVELELFKTKSTLSFFVAVLPVHYQTRFNGMWFGFWKSWTVWTDESSSFMLRHMERRSLFRPMLNTGPPGDVITLSRICYPTCPNRPKGPLQWYCETKPEGL